MPLTEFILPLPSHLMNKWKTLGLLALGATAAAIADASSANIKTNSQVLENIDVQLKIYSQGAPKNSAKTWPAAVTSFNTADLIQQVSLVSGFPYNKNDRLVLSTLYSNAAFGIPNTVNSNVIATWDLFAGTNVFVESTDYSDLSPGGTNGLDFGTGYTNGYLVTNGYVYQINEAVSPFVTNGYVEGAIGSPYGYLSNDVIMTAAQPVGNLAGSGITYLNTATFTNGAISAGPNGYLGSWLTILPQVQTGAGGFTNITITQYSPSFTNVFTNVLQQTCIITPTVGGVFSLYNVSDWVAINTNSVVIYNETGQNLSSTNFGGTNVATQTGYTIDEFFVNTIWPTNNPPNLAGQTNLYFDLPPPAAVGAGGFTKFTSKLLNLTVGGTAAQKEEFQVIDNATIDASAVAYVGGSITPGGTSTYTNTVSGITNTPTLSESTIGNRFCYYNNGTTLVTNLLSTNTISTTPVIIDGTVTLNFLSAGTAVTPIGIGTGDTVEPTTKKR